MLENLFMAFLFILVYFGLYCFLEFVDKKYMCKEALDNKDFLPVFLIKNSEHNIEWIMRNFYKIKNDFLPHDSKIVIIDMNSNDQTFNILERLSQQDDNLRVLKYDEKEKLFEFFEKTC